MTRLIVAAATLALGAGVAAVAVVGARVGAGVDRGRYVVANEAIFEQLPTYPGARITDTRVSPAYANENTLVGYTTLRSYGLPPGASARQVAAFYERRLTARGWTLVEALDGPVLNFRRGSAFVSINLESWRAGVLESAVDHDSS